VPLLEAATNLRTVKQNWTHSCAATLAAVLHLGRGRFGRGLMAVGFTEAEARVWWPQDLTDPPLLSTGDFPVEGDGYEADRFEKMLAIRGWREGLAGLRVCYRKGVWDRNCGTCFKCLVAGFFARAATGEDPPFLDRPLGEEEARQLLANTDVNSVLRLHQLRRHATRLGVRAAWLDETARLLDARGVTQDADGVPVVPARGARGR
jgi:hypothetical protein